MLSRRRQFVCSFALITGVAAVAAAQAPATPRTKRGPALPPAPFVQPEIGTVYRYEGFSNRITGGNGLTTMYADQRNQGGARFGVFFNDNITDRLAYSEDTLATLFPLSVGKRVEFGVSRGDLAWLFVARVVDTETIRTPAGTFDTYVVETIEAPKRTRSPAVARTRISTYWYAPSVRNVVRLMSITTTQAAQKQLRRVQLIGIDRPRAKAR